MRGYEPADQDSSRRCPSRTSGGRWWDSCGNRLRDMTYTCLCQLRNQEPECRAPGRHQLQGHHIRAVHLLSLSSHVKTAYQIFMIMAPVSTGEAPLDLSREHREPCDHQIISFRGEEDFTELQWRTIWKVLHQVFFHSDAQKLNVIIYTTGLSVLLQVKSVGSGSFFLILLFSIQMIKSDSKDIYNITKPLLKNFH